MGKVVHVDLNDIGMDAFQNRCLSTLKVTSANYEYLSSGLVSEIGEILDKVKKYIRDKSGNCRYCIYYNEKKCLITNAEISGGRHICPLWKPNMQKIIDGMPKEYKKAIGLVIGDGLYYLAVLAELFGFSLSKIARDNIEKLASRQARGKISGSGDNR